MATKLRDPRKRKASEIIEETVAEMYELNGYYQDLCEELARPWGKLRRIRMGKIVEKIGAITGPYI